MLTYFFKEQLITNCTVFIEPLCMCPENVSRKLLCESGDQRYRNRWTHIVLTVNLYTSDIWDFRFSNVLKLLPQAYVTMYTPGERGQQRAKCRLCWVANLGEIQIISEDSSYTKIMICAQFNSVVTRSTKNHCHLARNRPATHRAHD